MTAYPFDPTTAEPGLPERFWSKVDKRGADECWEWTGHRRSAGYGAFWLDGRELTASRIALALILGRQLLPDEQACHRCDNPPCCNPAHLFVGSHQDNMRDCVSKGRGYRPTGERHPDAVLTEEQVREIRASEYYYGANSALARRYGVSRHAIREARLGVTWKSVAS